jgi:hypothetical protein
VKSPRKDGSADPVDNQAQMTSRWVISQCPYCDEHGYLPNGFRCPHESPDVLTERAHRGAALARAALGVPSRPSRDEPYLPADLTARHETDQPEEETA